MSTPDLTTIPDRRLADWLFYDDVRRAELSEIDGFYCPGLEDEDVDHATHVASCDYCQRLEADAAERRAVEDEVARRAELGISIEDPDEPTLEERLAPFGPEWQREQREREDGPR